MKNLLIIPIMVMFLSCAGYKVTILGVDVKSMKGKDFGVATLGAVTAIGTHVLGHHIAAKLCNVDIRQHGLDEIVDYSTNPNESDLKWMARGGFLAQLAVNTALVKFKKDSYFTKGFTGATWSQLLTYNARRPEDGDFQLINENGGNGDSEYGAFLLWSIYNLYEMSVEEVIK